MKIDKKIIDFLQSQKLVTLGFSTGRDSLACALILTELGVSYKPFFFFHCPDLEFVENNIRYYEDKLQIEITRMPHPMLYDYLRHQDFQGPEMIYELDSMGFIKTSFSELISLELGLPEHTYYDIVGSRAAESLNRRLILRKNEGLNHKNKQIFPIWNWKTEHTMELIAKHNIKITADYLIWSRSFDGLKYQFLFGVKKNYPKDWQTLCDYFPLLPLELARYEFNIKYFPK